VLIFLGFIAACIKQTVPGHTRFWASVHFGWCATSLFSGHFGTFIEGRLIYIWLGAMLAMPAVTACRDSPD
jgi:hypothetical protein